MNLQIWTQDMDQFIWSLLESTTTALESLTIDARGARASDVILSDGAPLKHLSLEDISLNFDSERLSGLVILSLYGSAVPHSLEDLIQVLEGAAAQLEELSIGHSSSGAAYRPSSSITFPRLKNIKLEEISNSYSTALVATIYAPACSKIRVQESDFQNHGPSEILDAAIWKPGNNQVAAFLGLDSGSEPRALQIFIVVEWSKALEQLGQRTASPSWSEMETREDWVCPRLRSIMLCIPGEEDKCALHVAALRSLVQKRWSGAGSGLAPGNQPTTFSITCTRSSYEELKTVEAEIRQTLGSNADALRVAKSSLDKEADGLIFRIQVHRNVATPTYRIPAEVFEMIFKETLEITEDERRAGDVRTLLRLTEVCRHWYTTIINCPRLWTSLDSALPPNVAELVFERSRNLPILSLDWETAEEDVSDREKKQTLWMVHNNSRRFKSMSFKIQDEDTKDIWLLLESETTALESLEVDAYVIGGNDFTLSRGTPLKYLSLDDVSFGFRTQRLLGLVTLRLYRSAVPHSVKKLIRVLGGAAAQLEELTICNFESKEQYRPTSSITFPRLEEIEIKEVSGCYSSALLATIYAPACSDIRVEEYDFPDHDSSEISDAAIWKPGNPQVAAFLGLDSGPEPRPLQIFIAADRETIRINVKEQ
ncbi:hypothetical protein FRC01_008024, partial [Tulasnella sp. 417]